MAQSQAEWIRDVAEADFEREVLQRSYERPVVVDFWAPWCGPCRMLAPLLERAVAARRGEVLLAKVNIDEAQGLAMQFQISSIPAVIAFRDGRAVLDFLGLVSEAEVREFLDRVTPTEADRLVRDAAALEGTDPDEAEGLYRRALASDPRHEPAGVGLARLLIARGKDDEARGLLAEAGTTGPLGEEVEKLNGILQVRGLARGLPDEAALRQRLQADPKNAQLLYELGCVLAAAGRYEEALQHLLSAAERNHQLATSKVREAMVNIFYVLGSQSPLAGDYRNRLTAVLY